MSGSSARITVLGCGVSGLSTALNLSKAGHKVKIVAEKTTPHTTSDVAAAFWSPYHVDGYEHQWAADSLSYFLQAQHEPEAGICPVTSLEYFESESDLHAWEAQNWWRMLPSINYDRLPAGNLPSPFKAGARYTIPIIRMTQYVPFLMKKYRALENHEITLRRVDNLQDLFDDCDILINCAGLGSRTLGDLHDTKMYPCLGQLVRLTHVHCPNMIFMSTGSYAKEPLYIVPRCGKDIILGGTTLNDESWTEPQQYWTDRILQRCRDILPSLKDAQVIESKVGHRPNRHGGLQVFLDKTHGYTKPVIHNYGHGGAGVTLSWGCAQQVARIVSQITQ
jgi:D-amino-acid oxidase